ETSLGGGPPGAVRGRQGGYVLTYELSPRQALSPARRPFPRPSLWPRAAVRPGRSPRAAGTRRQAGPGDPAIGGGHPPRPADREQGGRAARGLARPARPPGPGGAADGLLDLGDGAGLRPGRRAGIAAAAGPRAGRHAPRGRGRFRRLVVASPRAAAGRP